MANQYYINKNQQENGDNEVHANGCYWMPRPENKIYLGIFNDGIAAVAEAKKLWPKAQINGCIHCSPESNTD